MARRRATNAPPMAEAMYVTMRLREASAPTGAPGDDLRNLSVVRRAVPCASECDCRQDRRLRNAKPRGTRPREIGFRSNSSRDLKRR